MALEAVRSANLPGTALVVLPEDLREPIWANTAGSALLGFAPGNSSESLDATRTARALEQIRSARTAIEGKGRAQLLIRPANAGMGRAVLARLERIAGPTAPLVLLTVRLAGDGETPEPQEAQSRRFLSEAGLVARLAAIVSAKGVTAGTDSLSEDEKPLLAAQGREFLQSEEDYLTIEDEAGGLTFARVARDLVLIHLANSDEEPAASFEAQPLDGAPAQERTAPEAGIDAAPSDPAATATGIGQIVERLRARPSDSDPEPLPEPIDAASDDTSVAGEVVEAPSEREPDGKSEGPAPFEAALNGDPVRFIWQTDAEGRFSNLSPEFAQAVGPEAANVVGRAFTDVARVFGFDESGEIAELLERRNTWSGRMILWPIQGTDRKAPVDLAALPVYGRERDFLGFRGFGMVRLAENLPDPAAIGLALGSAPQASDPDEAQRPITDAEPGPAVGAPEKQGAISRIEATPPETFGRRNEQPEETGEVVRLDDHRRSREWALSSAEEAAFRAIGAELGVNRSGRDEAAPEAVQEPVEEERLRSADGAAAPATDADNGSTESPDIDLDEFERILTGLPLPVLVQMGEALVFANRRFLDLTGYEGLEDLEEAGGLDHLILSSGTGAEGERASIRHVNGSTLTVHLHLQRITLAGRSCLLMSFPPADSAEEDDELAGIAASLQSDVEELEAVLDTATDGIVLLDGSERVRRMNGSAEALFGLPQDRYLGLPFPDLLAPESRQAAIDYIETLRDNGLASILNDGREVTAKVAAGKATTPLFVTLGRLSGERGWCVVIRDIAQWKRVESDLVTARRQAEDASLHKTQFLANISHELRTPLNAIIGFADVMASECFGPIGHERYLEYLGDIKRSGHHVLDLVNDLLDISKIEAGKIELNFEAVPLNEVVAEVVALMQPQANRERVIVRSNLPASIPAVVADRRSLRQIALNLLANAVRFTPAGGQIIASTYYSSSGEVTLRFRDSGIGMTDKEIEIALAPFQQVHASEKGRGEGTGLGLPLTKAMVEANRAVFSIASTPGEGTLVEITFPAQRVLAD